jgi:hypothetical protein
MIVAQERFKFSVPDGYDYTLTILAVDEFLNIKRNIPFIELGEGNKLHYFPDEASKSNFAGCNYKQLIRDNNETFKEIYKQIEVI